MTYHQTYNNVNLLSCFLMTSKSPNVSHLFVISYISNNAINVNVYIDHMHFSIPTTSHTPHTFVVICPMSEYLTG